LELCEEQMGKFEDCLQSIMVLPLASWDKRVNKLFNIFIFFPKREKLSLNNHFSPFFIVNVGKFFV
jgi:hypothetical protein